MGLLVHVYRRRDRDCTNCGVAAKSDRLLVIGDGDTPPDTLSLPVMVLQQHEPGAVSLRPLEGDPYGGIGPMAGGNYAVGDSKFNEAVEKLLGTKFYGAVAIHDRFESEELYAMLTH